MFCPKCGSANPDQALFCQACGASLKAITAEPIVQTVVSSSLVPYAGFWRRLGAAFLDGIILNIAGFIIGFIFGLTYGAITGTAEGAEELGYIFSILIGWIYYAVMESSLKQATLGKMALGIMVTDLAGNRISFGRATGRYFGKIVSILILMIGFLMIAFTERKQGLHDIMTGCLVVKK